MELIFEKEDLSKAIQILQGVASGRNTLPILSNVLIEAKGQKIKITATDLDIIYSEEIPLQELKKDGSTTTSASVPVSYTHLTLPTKA